jgi:hypothetical protein
VGTSWKATEGTTPRADGCCDADSTDVDSMEEAEEGEGVIVVERNGEVYVPTTEWGGCE